MAGRWETREKTRRLHVLCWQEHHQSLIDVWPPLPTHVVILIGLPPPSLSSAVTAHTIADLDSRLLISRDVMTILRIVAKSGKPRSTPVTRHALTFCCVRDRQPQIESLWSHRWSNICRSLFACYFAETPSIRPRFKTRCTVNLPFGPKLAAQKRSLFVLAAAEASVNVGTFAAPVVA